MRVNKHILQKGTLKLDLSKKKENKIHHECSQTLEQGLRDVEAPLLEIFKAFLVKP